MKFMVKKKPTQNNSDSDTDGDNDPKTTYSIVSTAHATKKPHSLSIHKRKIRKSYSNIPKV